MSSKETRGTAPLGRTRRATFRILVLLTAMAMVVAGVISLLVGFADPSMAAAAVIVPIVNVLLIAIGLGWLVWLVRSGAKSRRSPDA